MPVPILPIAMIGAQVLGPLIGELFAGDDDDAAREAKEKALAEIAGVPLPEVQKLVAQHLTGTSLSGVSTDGRFDAVQDEAMGRMLDVGRSGGQSAQGRARQEQAALSAASDERAQRQGILASSAARGTVGSGDELVAQLAAQQGGADRERMAGLQIAADDEERALQAIMNAGEMGGRRQATQWDQKAQVATAQDRINEFNAGADNNFALQNQANQFRLFDARMDKAGAMSSAYNGQAADAQRRADDTRQTWGGIGQAVGYGAGAYGQAQQQKQNPPAAQQPSPAAAGMQQGAQQVQPSPTKKRRLA